MSPIKKGVVLMRNFLYKNTQVTRYLGNWPIIRDFPVSDFNPRPNISLYEQRDSQNPTLD